MKAFFGLGELREAFAVVHSCVPTRSPKPVLMGIKMVIEGDDCVLIANDLEVGIRRRVGAVTVQSPGSVILPTTQVMSILKTAGNQEIKIEATDDSLRIWTDNSKFKMATEDAETFPDVPDWDDFRCHAVKAGDYRKLVRRTSYATDPGNTCFALNGVLTEFESTSVAMIATDGKRLSRMIVPSEPEGDGVFDWKPILPVKALRLVEKNLPGDEFPVHLSVQGTTAFFRTEDAVISTRLVEGRFPRYQDVIPDSHKASIPIKAGILRTAVDQAAIVTNVESRGISFDFEPNLLTLSGMTADVGQSIVKVPIEYLGEPVEVKLDATFVADILKPLDGEALVTIHVEDSAIPVLFSTEDGFTGMIAPLSKDR